MKITTSGFIRDTDRDAYNTWVIWNIQNKYNYEMKSIGTWSEKIHKFTNEGAGVFTKWVSFILYIEDMSRQPIAEITVCAEIDKKDIENEDKNNPRQYWKNWLRNACDLAYEAFMAAYDMR